MAAFGVVAVLALAGTSVLLATQVRNQREDIDRLERLVGDLGDLDGRVDAVSGRVDSADQKIAQLEAGVSGDMSTVRELVGGLIRDGNDLRERDRELGSQIDDVTSCVNDYMDTVANSRGLSYFYKNC